MDVIVKNNLPKIKELMRLHGVIRAHLFGSAAVEQMTADSDIDFMVSFDPSFEYTDYGYHYFQLMYDLQDLLKRDVELIAEETITNPYLHQTINRQKIAIL